MFHAFCKIISELHLVLQALHQLKSGTLTICALGFSCGVHFSAPSTQYKLLQIDLTVNISFHFEQVENTPVKIAAACDLVILQHIKSDSSNMEDLTLLLRVH